MDKYIEIHGIPRSIRLDQTKCLVGNQVKTFCTRNIIQIIEAPFSNHRAIDLVERIIQTTKTILACIKEEKLTDNSFHVKHALKIINQKFQICKQKKKKKISPFEAHFGRKPTSPLSVISTKPKLSNLSYEKIVIHFLDEDSHTRGHSPRQ